MKLVIEYLDGTKDTMNATNFETWEDFKKVMAAYTQVNGIDFVTDRGRPVWVPATAIKRIYPK